MLFQGRGGADIVAESQKDPMVLAVSRLVCLWLAEETENSRDLVCDAIPPLVDLAIGTFLSIFFSMFIMSHFLRFPFLWLTNQMRLLSYYLSPRSDVPIGGDAALPRRRPDALRQFGGRSSAHFLQGEAGTFRRKKGRGRAKGHDRLHQEALVRRERK